jgi:cellulose synthase/poly-beta-1,6-N-acetylglucosamine synthase-like glycosyltransferase
MIETVAVIVPAADEEDRIGPCLDAIDKARLDVLHSGQGVRSVEVVVVLDACRDRTASLVGQRISAGHLRGVRTEFRRVGAARRAGASSALAARGRADRLWLANTDADSLVPATWLTRMVRAANEGADAVLGTVLPGPEMPEDLRELWLDRHELREGHPHVHGANLGIRADAYLALGGWRDDLASHEDVDLVRRAEATGMTIRRTATIAVVTSARSAGRAPDGFARYVRDLDAGARAARS